MGLLTFQYFSLASVSDMDPESSTLNTKCLIGEKQQKTKCQVLGNDGNEHLVTWQILVTFCPGVGAMKILRSLTEPEAAESPPAPDDVDDGNSSREILMARYLERCSTRAVVVVLMNLHRSGKSEK